jgi:hypothetical protein
MVAAPAFLAAVYAGRVWSCYRNQACCLDLARRRRPMRGEGSATGGELTLFEAVGGVARRRRRGEAGFAGAHGADPERHILAPLVRTR